MPKQSCLEEGQDGARTATERNDFEDFRGNIDHKPSGGKSEIVGRKCSICD